MKKVYQLAIPALILAGILGGLGPIFGKLALRQFSPYAIVSLRFILSLLVLIPLIIKLKKHLPEKKDLLLIIITSLCWAGNVFSFILGLQYTTAIMSQIIYLLVPLVVLGLSRLIFSKKINFSQLIGLFLGLIGAGLALTKTFFDSSQKLASSLGTFKGNGIILMAVFCWSFYLILSKKVSRKYSAVALTTYSNLVTLLISLPFFINEIFSGKFFFWPLKIDAFIGILGMGLVMSVGMLFLYQWGNKHSTPFTAASVIYLGPLSAAIFAIPLFGEKLSLPLLLSAGLIFISVYLTSIYPLLARKLK